MRVGVGVKVFVGVGVNVRVGVGVKVRVAVGVMEAVGVKVRVGVASEKCAVIAASSPVMWYTVDRHVLQSNHPAVADQFSNSDPGFGEPSTFTAAPLTYAPAGQPGVCRGSSEIQPEPEPAVAVFSQRQSDTGAEAPQSWKVCATSGVILEPLFARQVEPSTMLYVWMATTSRSAPPYQNHTGAPLCALYASIE